MKNVTTISRIYFIGIGGIGMSALARYFLSKKIIVSGYDKTSTRLTQRMEAEGISIHYEDNLELLDKKADVVIYTPAIPQDHKEFNYFKNNNYEVLKRSDVLQQITATTYNICIAGTHGKTTISTMMAHLLRHAGVGCNAFLGGVAVNYDTNFWGGNEKISVVEADEYDRSFLKLSPDVALISAMDADHLDIYGTADKVQEAFVAFGNRLKPDGLLLTKFGLPAKGFNAATHLRYSLQNDAADVWSENLTMKDGSYEFDVVSKSWKIERLHLQMGGMHNVENAIAAITIAQYLEVDAEKIKAAIADFKGVKRRFEYVVSSSAASVQKNNVVYIDDYAHHPAELSALIKSAKSLFNNRKCTLIFQPHLFTRTRDFALEFAESLDLADEVLLLPIYPARELPIDGVSSEMIVSKMKNKNASVISKELLLAYLAGTYLQSVAQSSYGQLLITAGAGNIDQLVSPIKEIVAHHN